MAFARIFLLVLSAVISLGSADSNEFLAVSNSAPSAVADVEQDKKEEQTESPMAREAVKIAEVKEIEFDASNPYPATGATAEALALLFMIVACMICYLECCK
mmetsp:Transcript_56152/g.99997  ORF Transcript_56152/g.99997 Transcript_56152/m.99997 type:complete len:102 (-) Transcript_56152:108-413(-)|eukprot:CAMPEP_0197648528 /NCGR_PEP_ID=MMETSP1338-20131121/27816_1 /TAXON_ID=43686 ORGANISM="Pelagodinium beii, Strain RCC1491" /NCGR_SAMPLE_ID=MMETSP1338 /ASSEMBLY_ACC=CAM_ASM_000754 /LENGTH=101 /DNA_ID=CAMNT_0043222553 /DNA_START=64 /DNA_END=369 /DNA_ORIENTATION=+